MSAEKATTLERLLGSVPGPVRVGLFVVWAAVAVFAKWQAANDHDLSPVLWAVLLPGLAMFGALAFIRLWRSMKAPDRGRLDLTEVGWGPFFVITGASLVLGALGLFDDDPSTNPYISGAMLLLGIALVALFARHLAKPVRPEHENSFPGDGGATSWYVASGDRWPKDSDA